MRALALLVAVLLPASASALGEARRTFSALVTTNGFAPIVYDVTTRRVTTFREHLYRYPAPGTETRDLCYDAYLGVRVGGRSAWLPELPLDDVAYEPGTGIVRVAGAHEGLAIRTFTFSPMALPRPAVVLAVELEAEADLTDVALFSLHNFHLGGGPEGTLAERITWDSARGAFVERGERGALVAVPLGTPTRHAASPENPYPRVAASELLVDVDDSGLRDDAVSGYQLDVAGRGPFRRGERARFGVLVAHAADGDVGALFADVEAWRAGREVEALLADERAAWAAWHAQGSLPGGLSAEERAVALQSAAMLRMGQVREPGLPHGQIVASLPPGGWDITWARDALFAIRALVELGHLAEAEAGLDFLVRGPFGEYASYVGRSYGLSVARYYGSGQEESDWNAKGPNVELDGFGLYLLAAAEYAAAGGEAWRRANEAAISAGIASVLVDARDADTGLVIAESGIWESHWTDGGRQRWAFTSGMASLGLAAWARTIGEAPGGRFGGRAAELRAAIEAHLVDPGTGALAASVEQLQAGLPFADAQVAFLLHPELFAPGSPLGLATLDLLRSRLFLAATTGRGYKRNDDGDAYDEREWVVIDLELSRALGQAGRGAEARALIDWATAQATANFGIVPELLDEGDASFRGEAPMIGFGAGAYLRALFARDRGAVAVDGGVADAEPPADVGAPDAGPADALASDAGLPADALASDAGLPADAVASDAVPPDAGPPDAADAGEPDAGRRIVQSECACRAGAGRGSPLGALLLLLATRRRLDPRRAISSSGGHVA